MNLAFLLRRVARRARAHPMVRHMRAHGRSGSASLEFALVAPTFFILLMGIMETGILFFAQSALQNSVQDAARLVRTGQDQTTGMSQSAFRTKVCSEISPLLGCTSALQIDMRTFADFTAANDASPLVGGNLDPSLTQYNPGTACQVVLVRAFYVWPVVTPLLTPFLVNMNGNAHLLTGSAAFRNEPYVTTSGGC